MSTLLKSSFLLTETTTDMNGNHILKTDLILASGNNFLPLSQMFLKESFILVNGNAFSAPSPPEKKCFFIFRSFFHSGNHYVNYKEVYLKLIVLLLATIFFNFSDVSVNGSNFSV